MKNKLPTIARPPSDADLPREEIHLPAAEFKSLKSAIPFHHSPAQQEHMDPVSTAIPTLPPVRHKWHDNHDAMVEDYDSDVVLVERHDMAREGQTPL